MNNLDPGIYEIKLTGLKPNCTSEENMTRVVQVFDHDTTALAFNIHCEEKQQQIIYASNVLGDYNIYSADLNCCEQPIQLTFDRSQDRYPSISPDGEWVAYISSNYMESSLRVVRADGCCKPITLATNVSTTNGALLEWSPDGNQIAFIQGFAIATVYTNGNTPPTPLTDSVGLEAFPNWSLDGTQILYTASYDLEQALYIKEINGTQHPVQLTHDTLHADAGIWSADGEQVAFISQDNVFITDNEGSTLIQVTDDAVVKSFPKWSPDDSQIAYMTVDVAGGALQTELHVIDAQEGSNPAFVTSEIAYDHHGFEWSPNEPQFVCQTINAPEVVFTIDTQGVLLERVSNQTSSNLDPKWGGEL